VIGRVARAAVLLLVVSMAVFAATSALGSDAVTVRAGGRATPAELAQLRAAAGLDRPLVVRYVEWLGRWLTGDAGTSLVSGRPVGELVAQRVVISTVLVLAALAVAVPLCGVLVSAGLRYPGLSTLVTVSAAVPPVVVAAGLTGLLSSAWGLVPPVSLLSPTAPPSPQLLVLPVLTLAIPTAAYGAALLRGPVADAAALPFVTDAELRGIAPVTVALRYVGPVVAPAALRVLAVSAGALVAGTALVETLFGVSGLGELLVDAVLARDAPVVSAVAMLGAAVVVLGLLAADLAGIALDPRSGR
jgi:peptide/nickel transport system permease protein